MSQSARTLLVVASCLSLSVVAVRCGGEALTEEEIGPGEIATPNGARLCGAPEISQAEQLHVEDLTEQILASKNDGSQQSLTASHVIPVYVHRIHASNGTGGVVTNAQVTSQINVLNAAYASSGFSFKLTATDDTNNDAWYTATDAT